MFEISDLMAYMKYNHSFSLFSPTHLTFYQYEIGRLRNGYFYKFSASIVTLSGQRGAEWRLFRSFYPL